MNQAKKTTGQQDKSELGNNDLERYHRLSLKGNGTYGEVYEAKDLKTNQIVALKKIKLKIEADGIPSTALREISLLMEIDHPNVLSLKDVVISNNKLYLVFEFLDQDLKMFFDKHKDDTISPELIKLYVSATPRYPRLSLKENSSSRSETPKFVTLERYLDVLKIGDFGLARAFSVPVRQYTHQVITLWYRAIQILLGAEEYSTPVDIWSAGCIFAELFLKKPLFQGDSAIDQIYRIFRTLGTPTQKVWPGVTSMKEFKPLTFPKWGKIDLCTVIPQLKEDPLALELMESMLVFDPVNRISAKNALLHPYFKSLKEYGIVN